MTIYRRKIYAWRDPTPKPADYSSPGCRTGNCKYCRGRREAARRYDAAKLEASLSPGMFWDSQIFPGTKWDLGPSGPDRWIKTGVKNG